MKNKYIKIILITTLLTMLLLIACTKEENNNNNNTNGNNTNNNNNEYGLKEFNECLAEKGLKVYGTAWCPACRALVETLGGKDMVEPIYIECSIEQQRCQEEAKTGYVPEIQINGEVYTGQRSIAALANITDCIAPEQ